MIAGLDLSPYALVLVLDTQIVLQGKPRNLALARTRSGGSDPSRLHAYDAGRSRQVQTRR
jgi:hypothetical protein